MSSHLRWSGAALERQRAVLREIIEGNPVVMLILQGANRLGLPDPLLSAGILYNLVWNELSGKPPLDGIKDADLAYFDDSDLSYAAEDAVIRRAAAMFASVPVPVEVRNQARVHLWFENRFGVSYPKLGQCADMLNYYASRTHAVAARLDDAGAVQILAPFGLDDLFSFRLTPNPVLDNRRTHEDKAARAKVRWPQLIVVPWPDQGRVVPEDSGSISTDSTERVEGP